MSGKKKLIPRLRFPEFIAVPGWVPRKLEDVCEVNPLSLTFPEIFVYIDLESVKAGRLTNRNIIERDRAPSRAQRILQFGDVVFQIVRPYQRNNFHFKISDDLDYVASTGYAQLRAKESSEFLFQAIHVDKFVDRVVAQCTGSSYPAINSSDLAEIPLAEPQPNEQRKIADCLRSLDELIAAQARKVDALKTHKKGLMQQLFPREGETQPRLRFPEFRDAADWEKMRLGQMGDLVSGLTYSPDDVRDGGLLVLRSSNVQEGKISLADCVYVDSNIKGANLSIANDILICVRNGSTALIGKNALIPDGMPLCTHGAFMTVLRSKLPKFVFQLLQTDRYQRQVAGDLGATINSINGGQLVKYKFMAPRPEEQQEIAELLSSIDDFIAAQAQRLDALKTHKKGLMQQLFPAAEVLDA